MTGNPIVYGAWPADAAAVPAARRLVRNHVRAQGQPDLLDSVELLVSELVANVVLHVGGKVEVTAASSPGEVLIEVRDSSPVSPQLRMFSPTSSTGRGMRLVQSLSAEHGIRPSDHGGKAVWARVTAATAARSDDELAEGFAEVDWLADLVDVDAIRSGAGEAGQVLVLPVRGRPALPDAA